MKIATNQYFNDLTKLLTDQQGQVAGLQAKLAKGDQHLRPSEDAAAALKILDLNSMMSQSTSKRASLQNLDNRLQQEESAVTGIRNMLTRIQELAVMGANDTYSASDRNVIAAEIRGYHSQLLGLVNSQNTDGSFLFGGAKNGTPPFERAADGTISYVGDSVRIRLQIDGGQPLEINTTGYELFSGGSNTRNRDLEATRAFTTLESLINALESNDQTAISAHIADIDSLRSNIELATTKIGVRRNVIDLRLNILEEQTITLQGLLSAQKDLDYTQAITELSARMLALEAAQSTVSKISQLNLFNFLR
jgi:flagellar hook-associated protein 3 FlgL